jgi:hypothetical protein
MATVENQMYDKACESVMDKLVEDVGDWIDEYNLAHMITDAIREEYGTVTLEMAQDFWYRALEYHLPELFEHIARTLPDPSNEE